MPSYKKNHDEDITLCPTCSKSVPIIEVILVEGEVSVLSKCECQDEVGIMSLEEYIQKFNCSNTEESQKCSNVKHIHFKADRYCIVCQVWMCQDCLDEHCKSHSEHLVLSREVNFINSKSKRSLNRIQLDAFVNSIQEIDAFMQTNKEYNHKFNEWIDALVKPLLKYKDEINDAHYINSNSNYKIKKLCNLIIQTANILGDHAAYALNESISKIHLNPNPQLKLNSKDINKSYEVLMKHYNEHYAIQMKKQSKQLSNKQQLKCIKEIKFDETVKVIQLHDGNLLLSDDYQIVKQYDSSTFDYLGSFNSDIYLTHCVIQLLDGRLVSGLKSIQFWNEMTLEKIKTITLDYNYYITSLVELRDGRLASAFDKNMIHVWNTTTFEFLRSFNSKNSSVDRLIQLRDERLVSYGRDTLIEFWNINTFDCSTIMKTDYFESPLQLRDGRLVYGSENKITVLNVITLEWVKSFNAHNDDVTMLIQLKDDRLVSAGDDHLIHIWDVTSFKCLQSFKATYEKVIMVMELQDGLLASVSTYTEVYDSYNSYMSSIQKLLIK